MKIGELAQLTQCTVETIRYYEKEGLLPVPARTESNYRRYEQSHVDRLRFIRNCRALDMTLGEVRALLDATRPAAGDCDAVNRLIDAHIGHVRTRIKELQYLERQLKTLRQSCRTVRAPQDCNILQGLATLEMDERQTTRQTHL